MKKTWNWRTLIVGIVVLVILLAKMFSFQLRDDQVAVIESLLGDEGAAVRVLDKPEDRGLNGRWPWPINRVTKYETQLQLLSVAPYEVPIHDNNNIVIEPCMVWRISDAKAFYRTHGTIENATAKLKTQLRTSIDMHGYDLDQLVNVDPSKVMLTKIEEDARKTIHDSLMASNEGVEVVQVGIRKFVLPKSVTDAVFKAMVAVREARAKKAASEGEEAAKRIRSQAQAAKEQILTIAKSRAEGIRALGDKQAAEQWQKFADLEEENRDFAIFLREMETLEEALANPVTTLVLDPQSLTVLRWFDPTATVNQQAQPPKP